MFLPEACHKNILHLFMVSLPHEGISYKTCIIKNVIQNLCKLFLISISFGARLLRLLLDITISSLYWFTKWMEWIFHDQNMLQSTHPFFFYFSIKKEKHVLCTKTYPNGMFSSLFINFSANHKRCNNVSIISRFVLTLNVVLNVNMIWMKWNVVSWRACKLIFVWYSSYRNTTFWYTFFDHAWFNIEIIFVHISYQYYSFHCHYC